LPLTSLPSITTRDLEVEISQAMRTLPGEECAHVSGGDGTGLLGSGTRQGDDTPPPSNDTTSGDGTENDTGGTMGSGN
jgi:hypothetical protein